MRVQRLLPFVLVATLPAADRPWKAWLDTQPLVVEFPQVTQTEIGGVPVYLMEDHSLPRYSISLILQGGTHEEKIAERGITGLSGDMVTFSGSEEYPRDTLADVLEFEGSEFGFSDGFERCAFTISGLSEFLAKDIPVVTQVLKNPRFDNGDLDLLRRNVIKEIETRKENPGRFAQLLINSVWFSDNRGIYPSVDSVSALNPDMIKAWHQKLLTRKRLIIAAAGDINKEVLGELLSSFITSLPEGALPADADPTRHQTHTESGLLHQAERAIPQTTLIFRAPGIPHDHPDYPALKVWDHLLGGDSFNSELVKQIRTRNGWAYSVYSTYNSDKSSGFISMFAQSENKNIPNMLPAFEAILSNPEKIVTDSSVAEARSAILNKTVFLYERPEQYLSAWLELKFDGLPPDYLTQYMQSIARVSPAQVIEVARRYYRPELFSGVAVGPVQDVANPRRRFVPKAVSARITF